MKESMKERDIQIVTMAISDRLLKDTLSHIICIAYGVHYKDRHMIEDMPPVSATILLSAIAVVMEQMGKLFNPACDIEELLQMMQDCVVKKGEV